MSSSTKMDNRLDLLLLGGTGYTGKKCISHLHRLGEIHNLKWGVAGRSGEKLERVLKEMSEKTGAELQKIPTFIVDITDQASLEKAVEATKVLINCCGPFRFLGESVVKACINAGTHHVDISAEPQFMEKIQLDLDRDAKKNGVFVVTACGFDCLPTDLGVVFLQQHFQGTLNSVKTYLEVWLEDKSGARPVIGYNSNSVMNYGTWESLIHSVTNWREIVAARKKLFPESMDKYQPKLEQRYMPHKSEDVEGYAVPLPTADGSSVKRTQKCFYDSEKKRPIQISTYFVAKSFCQVLLLGIFVGIFYPLTRFKLGRKFLLNCPGLFTLGMFRKKPPSEEVIRNTWYQVSLFGEGWKDTVGSEQYQCSKPCDRHIIGHVRGRDGYHITSIGVVLSAIAILTEREKLPKQGGVYSAGACFSKTSLIQRLQEHGVEFKIIHQKDV